MYTKYPAEHLFTVLFFHRHESTTDLWVCKETSSVYMFACIFVVKSVHLWVSVCCLPGGTYMMWSY